MLKYACHHLNYFLSVAFLQTARKVKHMDPYVEKFYNPTALNKQNTLPQPHQFYLWHLSEIQSIKK